MSDEQSTLRNRAELDIETIRARLEAASPYPWEQEQEQIGKRSKPVLVVWSKQHVACRVGTVGMPNAQEDADFIQHAPADVAALLSALAEGRAARERAEAQAEELRRMLADMEQSRDRALSELEAVSLKARQYDSVVGAVRAADGGRYRADTIAALLARVRQVSKLEAEAAALRGAAEEVVDWSDGAGEASMLGAAAARLEAALKATDAGQSLLARLSALRAALEPFAGFARAHIQRVEAAGEATRDDAIVLRMNDVPLLLADLRRAAETLEENDDVHI